MGHDGVHVALHDYQAPLPNPVPGQVQGIQYLALVEDGAPGRVEVLGLGIVLNPASEACQPALSVPNREHEAAPEQVSVSSFLPLGDHTGQRHLFFGISLRCQVPLDGFAVSSAEADLELFDGLVGEATLLEVRPGPGPAASRGQHPAKEVPGALVDPVQYVGFSLSAPLLGQVYPALLGQPLQGFAEVQVLYTHQKAEDVSPGGAGAEAPPALALGEDEEGGGFLRVEWAEGLVASA